MTDLGLIVRYMSSGMESRLACLHPVGCKAVFYG